jgi:hypothetical protein
MRQEQDEGNGGNEPNEVATKKVQAYRVVDEAGNVLYDCVSSDEADGFVSSWNGRAKSMPRVRKVPVEE